MAVSPLIRTTSIVCGAAALILGGQGCALRSSRRPASRAGEARVARVIDGDTIVVRLGARDETVRLLGVDTPETKDPRRPVQCFGKEASAHTERLLPPGTVVDVARDVEPRDRYGRLLLYVWRARDRLFVNLDLAANGYADTLTYPPNVSHAGEFTAAVTRAREEGLGLWSQCGGPGRPVDQQGGGP